MVLCNHCGEEIEDTDLELDGDKNSYHKTCLSQKTERCLKAVDEFVNLCSPNGRILIVGIHVYLLHGKSKKQSKVEKQKRSRKRKHKLHEILNDASALRNSNSGTILFHLVGHAPGDTYTGALDELIDLKLNQIIEDDSFFCDVFTKRRLSACAGFEEFTDFIVLSVEASPTITTSDFKTKITLDHGLQNPSPGMIIRFLQRKRKFQDAFPVVDEVEHRHNLKIYQESRSVQMKSCTQNMIDKNCNNGLVNTIFNERRLHEYVSAFSKVENGGMFLFGIREEDNKFENENYISKQINPHGINISADNVTKVTKGIEDRMCDSILALDYSGKPLEKKDIFKVDTVPQPGAPDNLYVIRVLVKPVSGLVCHDKEGPTAYRVDASSDRCCIIRIDTEKWFDIVSGQATLKEL